MGGIMHWFQRSQKGIKYDRQSPKLVIALGQSHVIMAVGKATVCFADCR